MTTPIAKVMLKTSTNEHICLASESKWCALSVKNKTSELYLLLCWLIFSVIWIIRQKMSMNQIWIQPVYSNCELVTAGRVAAVKTTVLTSSAAVPFSRTPHCGLLLMCGGTTCGASLACKECTKTKLGGIMILIDFYSFRACSCLLCHYVISFTTYHGLESGVQLC